MVGAASWEKEGKVRLENDKRTGGEFLRLTSRVPARSWKEKKNLIVKKKKIRFSKEKETESEKKDGAGEEKEEENDWQRKFKN